MARQYWLMKSEPYAYSWQQLQRDGRGTWDGVRNFSARNNLRAMKKGDLALFYHSNEGKEVVGVAEIVREHYPDPTANEGDWSVVDVAPVKALTRPVTLKEIKENDAFADMALVTRARLSVQPVSAEHFKKVLALGKTSLGKKA
jgi:predicted RNA-binding protein with PUA-like domain